MWPVLLQIAGQAPPPDSPAVSSWLCLLTGVALTLGGVLYAAFWLWMLVHCVLHEPDKGFWLLLLVVAAFPGAIVYAIVRVFPEREWRAPVWLRRFTRRKELARLEAAAEQIGNAHQFVLWGDALRDTGQWAQAAEAYARALGKDPHHLPALWGAALTAERAEQPEDVERYCRQILDRDGSYKFGDVSLVLCRALLAQDDPRARQQLEQHCRRWRHPEAVYLLACRCLADGDVAAARQHLLELLRDLNSSPTAIARKHGRWKSLARRKLREFVSSHASSGGQSPLK